MARVLPALLIGLIACSPNPTNRSNTRTVTDELGRQVKLSARPARIISLAPSITETLFAIGAGDLVVGVTTWCDYPPEAGKIEKVGDTQRPSLEKIIGLKPDVVFVSTSSQLETFMKRLDDLGVAVFVTNPRDLEGMVRSLEIIAEVVGRAESGEAVARELRSRIKTVRDRVAALDRPGVLLILGAEPLITVGGTTFVNNLIETAGGRSIAADQTSEYPQFSLEVALARQPQIIFLQNGDEGLPDRLKPTPAARSGRVHRLNDALVLRPGPRLVDGLEEMAARIHPPR